MKFKSHILTKILIKFCYNSNRKINFHQTLWQKNNFHKKLWWNRYLFSSKFPLISQSVTIDRFWRILFPSKILLVIHNPIKISISNIFMDCQAAKTSILITFWWTVSPLKLFSKKFFMGQLKSLFQLAIFWLGKHLSKNPS